MSISEDKEVSPVVIGGLGGSGTRVVAEILKELKFYLGNYTNEQLDNLWFTFLFRRPMAFRYFHKSMGTSLELFDSVMKNELNKGIATDIKLYYIALEYIACNYVKEARKKFPMDCLHSILNNNTAPTGNWGWKEPNAHLFLDHLHGYYPGMKYIHVLRHPLDMAYGNNFLQLYNWHHLFNQPRPTKDSQTELMLAYYDVANNRAIKKGEKLFGENFIAIKLEDLCERKEETLNRLLNFLSIQLNEREREKLLAIPKLPETSYRYKNHDIKELGQYALDVCEKFKYKV